MNLTANNDTLETSAQALQRPQAQSYAPPSFGIYWLLSIAAITLLLLLPEQAKWVTTKRGWYTQPMVGPAIGLAILALFSACKLIAGFKHWRISPMQPLNSLLETLSNSRVALFSSALFFLYINTLSVLGFALSSLLFVSTLLWLSRLLDWRWFIAACGTVIGLVLIFRVGVSVWLPDVWLYDLLPESLAIFANQYL